MSAFVCVTDTYVEQMAVILCNNSIAMVLLYVACGLDDKYKIFARPVVAALDLCINR